MGVKSRRLFLAVKSPCLPQGRILHRIEQMKRLSHSFQKGGVCMGPITIALHKLVLRLCAAAAIGGPDACGAMSDFYVRY